MSRIKGLRVNNLDDTPGIVLPKEVHKQITDAFIRALPKRRMPGWQYEITRSQALKAASEVYPQFGEAGRIMLRETVRFLRTY